MGKNNDSGAAKFRIFTLNDEGHVVDNGLRIDLMENLRQDFPGESWAIVPLEQVPDNWADMTIREGRMVEKE